SGGGPLVEPGAEPDRPVGGGRRREGRSSGGQKRKPSPRIRCAHPWACALSSSFWTPELLPSDSCLPTPAEELYANESTDQTGLSWTAGYHRPGAAGLRWLVRLRR